MKTSTETDKIYPAFAEMQAVLGKAKKDSTNPAFKSKYADLESVLEVCGPAMAAHKFCITQGYGLEPVPHVYTRLIHTTSGQWMESACPLMPEKNTGHAFGSFTTYARRYSIVSMFNLGQEDDDGNAASEGVNASPSKRYEKSKGGADAKKCSVEIQKEIKNLVDANPAVTEVWWTGMKKKMGISYAKDMDEKQAKEILADLKTMEQ